MTKVFFAALCAASLLAPLSAQAGEVRNRIGYQQHRIYDGVQDGQINQREYNRLTRSEARIAEQRQNMLHDGDGRDGLTGRQFARLNREQNRLSRRIYNIKHDRNGHP